jgi:hypothetical protein
MKEIMYIWNLVNYDRGKALAGLNANYYLYLCPY